MSARSISLPLDPETARSLRAGERVALSGVLYAARDAAHMRLAEAIESESPLPVDLSGQTIYYTGPSPARAGRPVGAAGPTSSYRMDKLTPPLLKAGVLATIGKGERSEALRRAMLESGCLYLATIGGVGALLAEHIVRAETVAYEDLGPEALRKLEVKNFPVVVVYDLHGGDLYAEARNRWSKESRP